MVHDNNEQDLIDSLGGNSSARPVSTIFGGEGRGDASQRVFAKAQEATKPAREPRAVSAMLGGEGMATSPLFQPPDPVQPPPVVAPPATNRQPRAISALLGGEGMSERRLFPQPQTPAPAPRPVSAMLGGEGMSSQRAFGQPGRSQPLPAGYGLAKEQQEESRQATYQIAPEVQPAPAYAMQPAELPEVYSLARPGNPNVAGIEKRKRPANLPARYSLAREEQQALGEERIPLAEHKRPIYGIEEEIPYAGIAPPRLPKMPDVPEYKKPEYQDANRPLMSSMQSSLGSLPIIGQIMNAFGPMMGLMKAFSQGKEIGKDNRERADKALEDAMKIEEDNRKKASKALEDFTRALDAGQKQAEKAFRQAGMSPTGAASAARDWRAGIPAPRGGDGASLAGVIGNGGGRAVAGVAGGGGASAAAPAGAGIAGALGGAGGSGGALAAGMAEAGGMAASLGAVLGPIAAVGAALAAIPATAMAVVDAFNSVAKTSASFVEAYAPSSVLVFNQSLRDLTAVIGSGLLPVVGMATSVYRETGAILLPLMNELRPSIQAFSDAFGEVARGSLRVFGRLLDFNAQNLQVLSGAAAPLANVFTAMQDIGMSMMEALIAASQPMLPVLHGLVEVFKVTSTPLVMLGDAARAASLVFQAVGEAITESMKGFRGLNLTSIADGMRSSFQSIIQATIGVSAAFMKMIGVFDTAFGRTFLDKLIGAFDNPDGKKQSAVGLAAATDVRYSSFADFGRLAAQESAFAVGTVGEEPKKTEDWLKGIAADLEKIKNGEGNDVFADIIARAIKKVLDDTFKIGVYADNSFQDRFNKATGIEWLAQKIVDAGF